MASFAEKIADLHTALGPARWLAELEAAYKFEERVFVRARYRDERRNSRLIDLGGEG